MRGRSNDQRQRGRCCCGRSGFGICGRGIGGAGSGREREKWRGERKENERFHKKAKLAVRNATLNQVGLTVGKAGRDKVLQVALCFEIDAASTCGISATAKRPCKYLQGRLAVSNSHHISKHKIFRYWANACDDFCRDVSHLNDS